MDLIRLCKPLHKPVAGKIVLIVFDGLGGLPREAGGPTELEEARTPNLDALAARGCCGLLDNVLPGFTPGSGPAHLSLFGYDPLDYVIGRGLLETVGIDFPVQKGDLCVRVNLCTNHPDTRVVLSRRAGRVPTPKNEALVERLSQIRVPGCDEIFVRTVKEHRACIVFRAPDLYDNIADTDPECERRLPPHEVEAGDARSEKAARLAADFARQAEEALIEHLRDGMPDAEDRLREDDPEAVDRFIQEHHPVNGLLLRGFARFEDLPQLGDTYGLRCAAIATYPMYRGLARLVGMHVLEDAGESIEHEVACLERHFEEYDYFFLHIKKTDSYGEDGSWEKKVAVIEEGDALLPRVLALEPAVLAVTGDHSTPCILRSHSWHPVPAVMEGAFVRPDAVKTFGERACAQGGLGRLRGVHLMPVLVSNALGFNKYGA